MKAQKNLLIAGLLAAAIAVPVYADSEGTHDQPENGNGMMMGGGQQGPMPMMGRGPRGGMPMMGGGPRGGMPMMGGGPRGGMPMMQMMERKQAMMRQHMQTVEQRLGNIEALLRELVELQKR